MNIKGKIVTLRAIEEKDLEFMRDMMNDSEIESLVVGWAFPVSGYQQKQWYLNNIENNNNLRFIIEDNNGEAVGLATLTDIDWKNRKAIHGIKLDNKNRKRGLGTDALISIMRYAFNELQLNRLDASILEYNIASIKLHEKYGWKVEGKQRKAVYKNGKYNDLIIIGILREDYEEISNKNNYWGYY